MIMRMSENDDDHYDDEGVDSDNAADLEAEIKEVDKGALNRDQGAGHPPAIGQQHANNS